MLDESLHIRLYLAFYRNAIDFTSTAARGGYNVEALWRYKRGVTLKRVDVDLEIEHIWFNHIYAK